MKQRNWWLAVIATGILSGGSCFISGAFAGVSVALATYALANDMVTALAMYALPLAWAVLSSLGVRRRLNEGKPVLPLAIAFVVFGAILGFAVIYTIASGRASYLKSTARPAVNGEWPEQGKQ